jgi:hypothetical protein
VLRSASLLISAQPVTSTALQTASGITFAIFSSVFSLVGAGFSCAQNFLSKIFTVNQFITKASSKILTAFFGGVDKLCLPLRPVAKNGIFSINHGMAWKNNKQ